jgi:integrase
VCFRLTQTSFSALREQARTQAADAERWDEGWTDTGCVFTGEDGQPLHPDRVTKFFDEAQKRVTVPRIRLHDLRHTCAVLHLTAGVHVKVVQELLGHSTIAVTMDTYSHVLPGMHEDAAELIAALLAPTP